MINPIFCTFHSSKVRQENTDLLFSDLTLNESGIYQCVAENKHGMIVSSTYVKVLGELNVVCTSYCERLPVKIVFVCCILASPKHRSRVSSHRSL